jgi:hypothetical protein
MNLYRIELFHGEYAAPEYAYTMAASPDEARLRVAEGLTAAGYSTRRDGYLFRSLLQSTPEALPASHVVFVAAEN